MNIRRSGLIVVIFTVFSLGYSNSAMSFGVRNIKKQTPGISVRNEDGWDIPFLKISSEVNKRRISFPGDTSVSVDLVSFRPNSSDKAPYTLGKFPFYFVEGTKIRFRQVELIVKGITRCSVHDKVFCYAVGAHHTITGEQKPNAGIEPGPPHTLFYLDTDGDGKFETLEYGKALTREQIPEWVMKK